MRPRRHPGDVEGAMKLSRRELAIALVGLFVVVAFLLLFAVALPMRDRARKLADQARASRRQIDEAAQVEKRRPAVEREIASLQSKVDAVLRPGAEVTPALVRDIEKLCERMGVRMIRVRPEEPAPAGGCMRYPVMFEVESTDDQAVRLLYELEQPQERLWVEGVEIGTARGAAGKLRTVVHVAAYGRAPESEGDDGKA